MISIPDSPMDFSVPFHVAPRSYTVMRACRCLYLRGMVGFR